MKILITILTILFFGLGNAQLAMPPLPEGMPINVVKRKVLLSPKQTSLLSTGKPMLRVVKLVIVVPTTVEISWGTYTNAQVIIVGSTDLSTWYFKTNVPIGINSVSVPASQSQEFFRAYVTVSTATGFWVDSVNVLTNR
jgi:hypothetical protein